MSISISRSWRLLIGAVLLAAVLLAGCTGTPSGQPPATTPSTTAPPTTTLPTTTATTAVPATTVPTTTMPPAATVTTPPATATTPVPPAPVAATIQNFLFTPTPVTVPVGTTITWTNRDPAPHSIVSDVSGKFSSPTLGTGQSFSFTFTEMGSYPYHCGIHPSMHGTVVVT